MNRNVNLKQFKRTPLSLLLHLPKMSNHSLSRISAVYVFVMADNPLHHPRRSNIIFYLQSVHMWWIKMLLPHI